MPTMYGICWVSFWYVDMLTIGGSRLRDDSELEVILFMLKTETS